MINTITYSQRISIGKALQGATVQNSVAAFTAILDALHPDKTHTAVDTLQPQNRQEVSRAIDAVTYWVRAENEMLQYQPTPEEMRANIRRYTERVGEMATVNSIAEQFGQDPDTVLNWKYAKVFGILLYNLEKAQYQKRLNAQRK